MNELNTSLTLSLPTVEVD